MHIVIVVLALMAFFIFKSIDNYRNAPVGTRPHEHPLREALLCTWMYAIIFFLLALAFESIGRIYQNVTE